ncbi:MAG: CsbD family protein, partial [Pseudomonadota bacterium]
RNGGRASASSTSPRPATPRSPEGPIARIARNRAPKPRVPSASQRTIGGRIMANEDQAEGKLKDIGGKIKEEVGDATGDDDMKRDGQTDQAEGKLQETWGDAKDKL